MTTNHLSQEEDTVVVGDCNDNGGGAVVQEKEAVVVCDCNDNGGGAVVHSSTSTERKKKRRSKKSEKLDSFVVVQTAPSRTSKSSASSVKSSKGGGKSQSKRRGGRRSRPRKTQQQQRQQELPMVPSISLSDEGHDDDDDDDDIDTRSDGQLYLSTNDVNSWSGSVHSEPMSKSLSSFFSPDSLVEPPTDASFSSFPITTTAPTTTSTSTTTSTTTTSTPREKKPSLTSTSEGSSTLSASSARPTVECGGEERPHPNASSSSFFVEAHSRDEEEERKKKRRSKKSEKIDSFVAVQTAASRTSKSSASSVKSSKGGGKSQSKRRGGRRSRPRKTQQQQRQQELPMVPSISLSDEGHDDDDDDIDTRSDGQLYSSANDVNSWSGSVHSEPMSKSLSSFFFSPDSLVEPPTHASFSSFPITTTAPTTTSTSTTTSTTTTSTPREKKPSLTPTSEGSSTLSASSARPTVECGGEERPHPNASSSSFFVEGHSPDEEEEPAKQQGVDSSSVGFQKGGDENDMEFAWRGSSIHKEQKDQNDEHEETLLMMKLERQPQLPVPSEEELSFGIVSHCRTVASGNTNTSQNTAMTGKKKKSRSSKKKRKNSGTSRSIGKNSQSKPKERGGVNGRNPQKVSSSASSLVACTSAPSIMEPDFCAIAEPGGTTPVQKESTNIALPEESNHTFAPVQEEEKKHSFPVQDFHADDDESEQEDDPVDEGPGVIREEDDEQADRDNKDKEDTLVGHKTRTKSQQEKFHKESGGEWSLDAFEPFQEQQLQSPKPTPTTALAIPLSRGSSRLPDPPRVPIRQLSFDKFASLACEAKVGVRPEHEHEVQQQNRQARTMRHKSMDTALALFGARDQQDSNCEPQQKVEPQVTIETKRRGSTGEIPTGSSLKLNQEMFHHIPTTRPQRPESPSDSSSTSASSSFGWTKRTGQEGEKKEEKPRRCSDRSVDESSQPTCTSQLPTQSSESQHTFTRQSSQNTFAWQNSSSSQNDFESSQNTFSTSSQNDFESSQHTFARQNSISSQNNFASSQRVFERQNSASSQQTFAQYTPTRRNTICEVDSQKSINAKPAEIQERRSSMGDVPVEKQTGVVARRNSTSGTQSARDQDQQQERFPLLPSKWHDQRVGDGTFSQPSTPTPEPMKRRGGDASLKLQSSRRRRSEEGGSAGVAVPDQEKQSSSKSNNHKTNEPWRWQMVRGDNSKNLMTSPPTRPRRNPSKGSVGMLSSSSQRKLQGQQQEQQNTNPTQMRRNSMGEVVPWKQKTISTALPPPTRRNSWSDVSSRQNSDDGQPNGVSSGRRVTDQLLPVDQRLQFGNSGENPPRQHPQANGNDEGTETQAEKETRAERQDPHPQNTARKKTPPIISPFTPTRATQNPRMPSRQLSIRAMLPQATEHSSATSVGDDSLLDSAHLPESSLRGHHWATHGIGCGDPIDSSTSECSDGGEDDVFVRAHVEQMQLQRQNKRNTIKRKTKQEEAKDNSRLGKSGVSKSESKAKANSDQEEDSMELNYLVSQRPDSVSKFLEANGVTPKAGNLSISMVRRLLQGLQDDIAVSQESVAGSILSASPVASEEQTKKQIRRKLMMSQKSGGSGMSQGSSMPSFNQSLTSINEGQELTSEQMKLELGSKVPPKKLSAKDVAVPALSSSRRKLQGQQQEQQSTNPTQMRRNSVGEVVPWKQKTISPALPSPARRNSWSDVSSHHNSDDGQPNGVSSGRRVIEQLLSLYQRLQFGNSGENPPRKHPQANGNDEGTEILAEKETRAEGQDPHPQNTAREKIPPILSPFTPTRATQNPRMPSRQLSIRAIQATEHSSATSAGDDSLLDSAHLPESSLRGQHWATYGIGCGDPIDSSTSECSDGGEDDAVVRAYVERMQLHRQYKRNTIKCKTKQEEAKDNSRLGKSGVLKSESKVKPTSDQEEDSMELNYLVSPRPDSVSKFLEANSVTPKAGNVSSCKDGLNSWHIALSQDSLAGSSLSASTVASEEETKKQIRRKLMMAHKSGSQGSSMLSFNQSLTSINEGQELTSEQMELLELGSKVSPKKLSAEDVAVPALDKGSKIEVDDNPPRLPQRTTSAKNKELSLIQNFPESNIEMEEQEHHIEQPSPPVIGLRNQSRPQPLSSQHKPLDSSGSCTQLMSNEMPEVKLESPHFFLQLDFQALGEAQYASNMEVNKEAEQQVDESSRHLPSESGNVGNNSNLSDILFRTNQKMNGEEDEEDRDDISAASTIMDQLWLSCSDSIAADAISVDLSVANSSEIHYTGAA